MKEYWIGGALVTWNKLERCLLLVLLM